jgi:VanZ family protein
VKKFRPSFTPAVLWLIFSTVLLTLPGSSFPKEDWLSRISFDKWVHAVMFAIMVILWCRAMLKTYTDTDKLKRLFLMFAVIWLGYGIAMEFIQLYFIKNRSFDAGDIAADALGCIIGYIYSRKRYIKK